MIPNPELDFWNSDPKIHFWANFCTKSQSCPFCLKIGTHSISRMLIPNPYLDFWNFDPKIHFWANLSPKSQSCPFCLKIGEHSISRMLILIPTLVFWISNQKSLFAQIWDRKVKVVRFAWKLAHMISRTCRFLFQQEYPTLNSFWGKFRPKKSKNWHTWHLEDADSYFNNCFLNFELKIHFWPNLGQKSQIYPFCLKICTLGILRMWIIIPRLVFWISKCKSI